MSAQRCPLCGSEPIADHQPACGCATSAPAVPANPVFGQVAPPGRSAGTVAQEDLRLFEGPVGDWPAVEGMSVRTSEHVVAGRGRRPPARLRRQWVIVGTAALGVGAAAVIAVASGVFSSGTGPSQTVSAADDSAVPAPSGSVSSRSADPSPENGGAHVTRSPSPSSAASGTESTSATAPASASAKSSVATPAAPAPTVSSAARPVSGARVLSIGSHGGQVKDLQRRLTQLNLYTEPADGSYSTDVADAVHRYQVARGIDEDAGVYGPETRAALESETRHG
ncbi:peptidoglycan-binding protein [Streptomyces sp. NPDC051956]|uniref:peptidoglycan-binding protein n=1 Tax=Streptomyces sp. NPDC051956 TaxID=3365677 RepID=UPI0037CF0569